MTIGFLLAGIVMKNILILSLYCLLALFLLFAGFFITTLGGLASVGGAIVMWMLSGIVVVWLVVPKFARLIESHIKKTTLKQG